MANLRTPPGLNPRDKRPGEKRTLRTAGRAGGPIWYFLGGLLLLVLVLILYAVYHRIVGIDKLRMG